MSRGGIVAPELPEKSHILWVSLEMYSIQHLDPPPPPPPPRLMLDPPLKPWKIIVFFEITIGYPL